MFTNAEMIVGMWFVPVVLCILIPLVMLCVWYTIQMVKGTSQTVEEAENAINDNVDHVVVRSTQP